VAAFGVAMSAMSAVAAAGSSHSDGREAFARLVSTGFRGATRLARSDPAMVASFLSANRDEVRRALADLVDALTRLGADLDDRAALERSLAGAGRVLESWP
jgi:prephenate dehydrogenase